MPNQAPLNPHHLARGTLGKVRPKAPTTPTSSNAGSWFSSLRYSKRVLFDRHVDLPDAPAEIPDGVGLRLDTGVDGRGFLSFSNNRKSGRTADTSHLGNSGLIAY